MTFEIALALTLLVFLAVLAAITFWTLSRLLTMVAAHVEAREEPALPPDFVQSPDPTMSAVAAYDKWPYRPIEERVDDEDSGPTLLPFSTPLPPFPHFQMVEYSEDEDDVPTTLYRTTDDDGEMALLADLDD